MKRTKTVKRKKKSDTFLRVSLFLAAFLVFALILTGIVILWFTVLAPEEAPQESSSQSEVSVTFTEEDQFPFVVAGIDSQTDTLGCVLLLRVDPANGRVDVTPIPKGLTASAGSSEGSLSDLYSYGGITLLTEAIQNASGIAVDKYVEIPMNRTEKLINTLGAIDVDIPEAIDYHSEEGYSLTLAPGRHTLDGLQVLRLLRYSGWEGGIQAQDEMCGKVMCSIINQHLNENKISSAETLFTTCYNLTDTNIGIMDFTNLLPALTHLAQENSGSSARLTTLAGEYSGTGFVPAEGAWQALSAEQSQ